MTEPYLSRSYTFAQKFLIFVSVALCYFFLGWASLKLATINDFSSPVWSPSGFAVGALVVFGTWLAPAIFVGALLTNATISDSILSLLSIATGNALEAFLGATILIWLLRRNFFKNYTEFMAIVLVAILACSVSATFGTSTLLLSHHIQSVDYGYVWYTWWSGDAVGIMIVLPFFLEFYLTKKPDFKFSLKNISVALLFLLLLFSATYLVFVKGHNQAISWIMCPFLILSGLYLGKLASRAILICVAILIVILTTMGYSPFEFGSLNLNLIYVQSLLLTYSFAILFIRPLITGLRSGLVFTLSNLIGWSCIFIVIFMTAEAEKSHLMDDLNDSVDRSIESLQESTHQYELLLEGGKALLQIKPKLTYVEWRDYVNSLKLETNYDAINGFGFIRYKEKKDVPEVLKSLEKRGIHNFVFKEIDKDYSERFNDRFLIYLVEPLEKNLRARGLDIGSEPNRREAAVRARNENITVATKEIQLIQDDQRRPAFLLLHPVWDQTKTFIGWTYAPTLSDLFFSKSFSHFSSALKIKITRDNQIVYKNFSDQDGFINPLYLKKYPIKIFGNNSIVEFYPQSDFLQRHSHSTAPLAVVLSLFMLFIAGFLLEQLTFSQRTEQLVTKRTQELEESKIQLINSSKMASLGEMASGMAHEINNPITIILGKIKVISVMLEELKVHHPPLNAEINRIELTTDRISKIVKGLKSFSRAAQNDPFELVPLDTIIQETLDLCSERLKANGINIKIDEIPQICLYCRPSQISQVLMNLFNNSSDALTDAKEKVIAISFKIREPDRLFIFVTDTGKGISPDIASKIMDPFFTTKSVGKGTGLGLSIAKGIIEGHGGSIWLDDKSPNTRFVLEFPIRPV